MNIFGWMNKSGYWIKWYIKMIPALAPSYLFTVLFYDKGGTI